MNITVLSVGVRMLNWVNEAIGEYSRRLGREISYVLKEIKPEKRGSGVNVEQGMAAEERWTLEAIPQRTCLAVLDERGKTPTSLELASHSEIWMQNGDHICFIAGGTDGMIEELKQQAKLILRSSSLTLSHGMVYVLPTE